MDKFSSLSTTIEASNMVQSFVPLLLSPNASGRIGTLNFRIMSQVFYHCATVDGQDAMAIIFSFYFS
jgi:hypothetical protein